MELPAGLRSRIDALLADVPIATLKSAGKTLSDRYRAEVRDGRLHMDGDIAVKAYLATRLPATYAAIRTSLEETAASLPHFSPLSLLDIGAGPGTVLWATKDCWPGLERATMLEASNPARTVGQSLASAIDLKTDWRPGDATIDLDGLKPADLVTAAYVLDEVAPLSLAKLIEGLWRLTTGVLLLVEPGTPAGWRRILDARAQLIGAGAHVAAPCPHESPCPLIAPDWCHFSRRVARSRLHRLAKDAEVPWEDEKFIYVAASRLPLTQRSSRVLAPPKAGSGKVALKLCQQNGSAAERLFTKRDGAVFKLARRADWGDTLPDS